MRNLYILALVAIPTVVGVVFTTHALADATTQLASPPTVDTSYVLALNAADECLTAWMNHDPQTGIATLTDRAKKDIPYLPDYFSGMSNPHNESFEVTFDKRVGNNVFWFNVWEYTYYTNYDITKFKRMEPSHMEVIKVMVHGQPKWLVDVLPAPVSK